jgi:rhodanese-related sulfurtransferase
MTNNSQNLQGRNISFTNAGLMKGGGNMEMSSKFKVLFLAAALIFGFTTAIQAEDYKTSAQLVAEAKSVIKQVTVQDLKEMLDKKENVILLDVRDKDEYEKQHIPGSIHMSRGDLEFHVNEIIPDKNAKIVVIWIFNNRSPLATKTLNEIGYVNTVNLDGGIKAWMDAGYPLARNDNKKGYSLADRY